MPKGMEKGFSMCYIGAEILIPTENHMSYKLIAFDMDGTFFDDNKRIPQINMEALEAASARGCIIVPATGRIFPGLPAELKDCGFVRYCITINGAYVYDSLEDRALYEAGIPLETALELADYLAGLPVIYDCYRDNWGYMTASLYNVAEEYISSPGNLALIKNLRSPVPELRENIREVGKPVQKMQAFFKDEKLRQKAIAYIHGNFPELAVTSSVPNNIEINSAGAQKGPALEALCAQLKIPMSDTIAFGDGSNDISMLRAAGLGIAMENADDEVKAAADKVCSGNNSGGVGLALKEILGL